MKWVENMLNSTWIELKMWATQFKINLSSKCQLNTQLDDQSKQATEWSHTMQLNQRQNTEDLMSMQDHICSSDRN